MYQSVQDSLLVGALAFAIFMVITTIHDADCLKKQVTRQRCELMGLRYEIDEAKAAKLDREQSNE